MNMGDPVSDKKFSTSDHEKKPTVSDPDSNIRQSNDTMYAGLQKSVEKLAVKS